MILTFVGLKLLRSSYGITLMHYGTLVFSVLYIKYDTRNSDDSILVTYFLATILFVKVSRPISFDWIGGFRFCSRIFCRIY